MKRILSIAVTSLLLLSLLGAAAFAHDPVNYDIPKAVTPPVVDGAMGENADEEIIKEAAANSRCADFIEKTPLKYDTMCSLRFDETGAELSGGKNQRLALARAV